MHVGEALIARDGWPAEIRATWPRGSTATQEIRASELALERAVSVYIGALPFLWVAVEDWPGPNCDRAVIEAGSIAVGDEVELVRGRACTGPAAAALAD